MLDVSDLGMPSAFFDEIAEMVFLHDFDGLEQLIIEILSDFDLFVVVVVYFLKFFHVLLMFFLYRIKFFQEADDFSIHFGSFIFGIVRELWLSSFVGFFGIVSLLDGIVFQPGDFKALAGKLSCALLTIEHMFILDLDHKLGQFVDVIGTMLLFVLRL